jgi:TRAP-type C4-dicarboxylate transport system permease small subunit
VPLAEQSLLHRVSVALALIGGAVLAAMALLATVSILGRWWFSTPVWGDVELVQMGTAVAIALSLPYAQFKRAHIMVDFFTTRAAPATRARLDSLGSLLLGLVCLLLAWRAGVGVLDMRSVGETTMVLGFPIWIVYVAMVIGLAVTSVVGVAGAWRLWRDAGKADAS